MKKKMKDFSNEVCRIWNKDHTEFIKENRGDLGVTPIVFTINIYFYSSVIDKETRI